MCERAEWRAPLTHATYSQYGEDLKVAEILSQIGEEGDSLLDIGAWGVKDFSNSRTFIERGWRAVLVEFSPLPVDALVREYGYNDRVRVIQAAITAEEQHVQQFEITEDALSSNDPEQVARWKDMDSSGGEGPNRGGFYGRLWVPTLTIQELIDQFFGDQQIDFASIDTEGSSVGVALALMRTNWRPRVICVEYDNRLAHLQECAQEWGYKTVHTNSTNVILVR